MFKKIFDTEKKEEVVQDVVDEAELERQKYFTVKFY
jgi:hypothetical protein